MKEIDMEISAQAVDSFAIVNTDKSPVSHLRQEYQDQQRQFRSQPLLIQRYLEAQAAVLADAVLRSLPEVHFTLPDQVVTIATPGGDFVDTTVPAEFRQQVVGGLMDRFERDGLRRALRQRLVELEHSVDRGTAVSASLLRYAMVIHMIYQMLPSGRSVTYQPVEGEEIPSVPLQEDQEPESAMMASTDAITEAGAVKSGRGELAVPYVKAAQRFYLPQWVAFDDQGQLLMNSVEEAEAHLASMQNYLSVLHAAVGIAPYMVADPVYQQKRYGILGQLVNQGRAFGYYEAREIINSIKRRAAAHDLNRGLSLSLPYFDDQNLEMRVYDFEIIPFGRVMFVPAFVVLAARGQQAKVAQDTRLSPSTRRHLLAELRMLEQEFISKGYR
jgi:hypothetical protein